MHDHGDSDGRRLEAARRELREAAARRDACRAEVEEATARFERLRRERERLRRHDARPVPAPGAEHDGASLQERVLELERRLEEALAQAALLGRDDESAAASPLVDALEERDALRTRLRDAEDALEERAAEVEALEAEASRRHRRGHLVLVGEPSGYRLLERPGPPPAPGEVVELDGRGPHLVLRVARAPLPGRPLPCAYVIGSG